MNMRDYLQTAVDYIEENITEPLNLETIGNHIGFSKYYLNSMFSLYTGMSLIEYTRKRKLVYGINQLKRGMRIIDIAFDLGYSCERSFSRAIKNSFGESPSYYRDNNVPLSRKLNVYDLKLTLDEEKICSYQVPGHEKVEALIRAKGVFAMKSYLSDVRYEKIDRMKVISTTAFGNEPEEEVITRLKKLAQEYHLNVNREFGFDVPVEGSPDMTEFRGYEYWLAVDEKELDKLEGDAFTYGGGEICVKDIPGYRYATLTIEEPFVDPFERIPGGFRALVSWLETHDFAEEDCKRLEKAHCLEEVLEGEKTVMNIYIPVDCL
ncbi:MULTISPECIES: helix-turn-helix domain-containing protein [unclassified Fusibacter]|uniref:helix-turn-helix domain-containing protein n=1 Tax=unclassified Fusibacter TaxID=2624464 RepID=UPI001013874D|nr:MULTISPECIES: helix-turn-helix domain-containing protein [unclassified Fusibacter]MCK8058209.1 AraC family transcriptional regulator [Fusibacter sp. A2]NPE20792.1 AraC family transcriptional regulator [Fusibacter sp. A1]RXV62998.1 AraC family transcriptional regulator [Fusibacter sp. A1]